MSDFGSYPRGKGFAWRGDWLARLLSILNKKGEDTLSSFVAKHPLATMDELVKLLGEGDVAPVQLKWRLVEEARSSSTLRDCALDLLVRYLHEVHDGWPADLSWEGLDDVRSVLVTWRLALNEERYNVLLRKMSLELLGDTSISPGWKPGGVRDPILVALFDKHWPTSPQEGT